MKLPLKIGAAAILVTSSVAMATAGEIKVWNREDLLASDQLVTYGKRCRDTALQPFNPASNAKKGFMEQAAKASCSDVYVIFEGERKEENSWGVSGMHYIVDGNCIIFVPPSKENIAKAIKGVSVGSVPFESAIVHARKNPDAKEIAAVIIQVLKDDKSTSLKRGSDKAIDGMIAAYGEITGKEGAPELTKLLKYHPSHLVKVSAGKQLVKLGESGVVEEALKQEENQQVRKLLSKALME